MIFDCYVHAYKEILYSKLYINIMFNTNQLLIKYNVYAIILSNTIINVQHDRLYHRVLGHAHSS